MSDWSAHIELRMVEGETRAFRTKGGREVPIPKLPQPEERNSENGLMEWLDHLTLDELEASRQYYWDRWNWESGLISDKLLSNIIETRIYYRVYTLRMREQHMRPALDSRLTLDLRKNDD